MNTKTMIEYLQRLATLQTLHDEINLQLNKELSSAADVGKLQEYQLYLQQIKAEIKRIESMKSYSPKKA